MKIAFIVNTFPALSETFILNQITGLIDLGHEVEIYSRTTPVEQKVHDDVEKYKLNTRTHYLDNVPKSKIIRVLKALILLIKNFHINPFAIMSSFNAIKYGREALSLYFFYNIIPFLGKNYDIIHCHFGPNGNFGLTLNKIGIRSLIITSFYGYDISSYVQSNSNSIYKSLFNHGHMFVAISDYMFQRLENMGCFKSRLVIHRLGIDLKKFEFQEKKICNRETIKILTVARLSEKKGLEYSIKAVAKVMQEHLNIEYQIIGDGPLRKEISTLISQNNLETRIKLLGWMTQDEVRKCFTESHIFILPSITANNGDQEGTPTVLIEAQAQGLPTISTYHSGIPEVIQDGKSGFLVPERDIDALVHRLKYLIDNSALWPEMGSIGRKYIEAHYDIKKLNKKLEKLYEGMLSQNN